MNILENIRDVLVFKCNLLNTTIGNLQTDKDECVSLFPVDGDRQNYFGGKHMDSQPIRIVVRDPSYQRGTATIEKIKEHLDRYHDDIIRAMFLTRLENYLGKDTTKRNVWEINFKVLY